MDKPESLGEFLRDVCAHAGSIDCDYLVPVLTCADGGFLVPRDSLLAFLASLGYDEEQQRQLAARYFPSAQVQGDE